MRVLTALLLALLMSGCMLRAVQDSRVSVEDAAKSQSKTPPDQECPGGRINSEQRVTDVFGDRTRNTTRRSSVCLD